MAIENYQFVYHREVTTGLSRRAIELQRAKERSHAAKVSHARIRSHKINSASFQGGEYSQCPHHTASQVQTKVTCTCTDHAHPHGLSVIKFRLKEAPSATRALRYVEAATIHQPVSTNLLDPFLRLPIELSEKDRNVLHFCKCDLVRSHFARY